MEKIRVAFIGMDHVHVQTLANDFVKYSDRIDILLGIELDSDYVLQIIPAITLTLGRTKRS